MFFLHLFKKCFIAVFFIFPMLLVGQETLETAPSGDETQVTYVVRNWILNLDPAGGLLFVPTGDVIEGSNEYKVRLSAVKRQLNISDNMSFSSFQEMKNEVLDLEKKLTNTRYYETVSFTLKETDDTFTYDVSIDAYEASTLFFYAFPKIDSNDGFRLKVESIFDNAFGSLTDWSIGGSIDYSFISPYSTDDGRVPHWKFENEITGIDFGSFDFDVSMGQYFDEESKVSDDGSDILAYFSRYTTKIGVDAGIEFYDDILRYTISPTVSWFYGYHDLKEEEVGDASVYGFENFSFRLGNSLSADTVDWVENYREGVSGSVTVGVSSINPKESNDNQLNVDYSSNIAVYDIWFDILNPSLRAGFKANTNQEVLNLGGDLRGVPDNFMFGKNSVYFNTSLTVSVVKLPEWWWGPEVQLSPFFDVGWADQNKSEFSASDVHYGIGFDVIGYVRRLQNLVARLTVGFDLNALMNDESDRSRAIEVLITADLHF